MIMAIWPLAMIITVRVPVTGGAREVGRGWRQGRGLAGHARPACRARGGRVLATWLRCGRDPFQHGRAGVVVEAEPVAGTRERAGPGGQGERATVVVRAVLQQLPATMRQML